MEPGSEPSVRQSEPERWLGIAFAEKLLAASDLIGSKRFVERALDSDPLLPDDRADQIIAIADVLLASQKRINNQRDWYSILNLNSSPDDELHSSAISLHFRRLARLLHPTRNQLPFAAKAFELVSDAYSVLSDPVKKSLFDSEIRIAATAKADQPTGPLFWTACPSCCHVHEYERVYEGKNLRCPKCRRAFRAAELAAPPPIVAGTNMYYCSWGFFPLAFAGGPQSGPVGGSQPSNDGENAASPFPAAPSPPVPKAAPKLVRKKTVAKKTVGVNLKRKSWGSQPVKFVDNEEDEDQIL